MAAAGEPGPTESSLELDRLLDENGPDAERIRGRFHRTMLWRLRTGKRSPDLKSAVDFEELSGGRIKVTGWLISDKSEHQSGDRIPVALNPAANGTEDP